MALPDRTNDLVVVLEVSASLQGKPVGSADSNLQHGGALSISWLQVRDVVGPIENSKKEVFLLDM